MGYETNLAPYVASAGSDLQNTIDCTNGVANTSYHFGGYLDGNPEVISGGTDPTVLFGGGGDNPLININGGGAKKRKKGKKGKRSKKLRRSNKSRLSNKSKKSRSKSRSKVKKVVRRSLRKSKKKV